MCHSMCVAAWLSVCRMRVAGLIFHVWELYMCMCVAAWLPATWRSAYIFFKLVEGRVKEVGDAVCHGEQDKSAM